MLDTLDRLDETSFVFVVSSIGALTRALILEEPRPETIELVAAIDVYLAARGCS